MLTRRAFTTRLAALFALPLVARMAKAEPLKFKFAQARAYRTLRVEWNGDWREVSEGDTLILGEGGAFVERRFPERAQ